MRSVLSGFLVLCQVALLSGAVEASEWWESVKVKGDFRYRYEYIGTENKPARNRHRIRARLGFQGEVSPYTTVVIQLSSGSDDPVSNNQTLGDGFSTKPLGLDVACFRITHPKAPGFTLEGGKFHNPFFKPASSELLWDSDWNPEGGTLHYTRDFPHGNVTLTGAGFWVDERSTDKDSYMAAAQGALRLDLNDKKTALTLGAGYFNYVHAKGYRPFWDPEDSFGNTTRQAVLDGDTVAVYATDFDLVELSALASSKIGEIPVTVAGDFVTNTAADSLGTGWLVALGIGKAAKVGGWELRYVYREVDRDAVVGIYTDSDFRGGGTDGKGHEFGGVLQIARNTTFNVTYFSNSIGTQSDNSLGFKRVQIDLQTKF